jgi:hypothetical protein
MNNATTTNGKVTVDCGRCAGSGRYYFNAYSTGDCYGCGGKGKITMSAAEHAKLVAAGKRAAAVQEREIAAEDYEARKFDEATAAVEAGHEAARTFWTSHKGDGRALAALICAMRNAGYHDAANAVVRDNSRRGINVHTLDVPA